MHWRFAPFDQLTVREVHDLFQARVGVFVVEQTCPFQDVDGIDPACWHLLGTKDGRGPLLAYCRLVPPGVKYEEPSIGRIITAQPVRRTGLGRELVRESLARAEQLWPGRAIRIGAQQRLERFYEQFGFVTASAPYDEDGIAHVEMVRPAARAKQPRGETIGR